ncbi:MAG: type IV pilus assembly protein PilO [Clostridium sp.]|jgi:type IV pilus assembly protein PilO
MKVTKREQILIGSLLILFLFYGFYKFVYTKQNQKITKLKASRDTYSQKWEQVKAKIASKDKKLEQYKILNAKISSKTDMMFPTIEQEEIIVVLDKMIKDSKLQADVLAFTEVSSNNTTEDKSKTNAATNEKITINELDKLVNEFNGGLNKDAVIEKANTSKVEANAATTDKAATKTVSSKLLGAYTMQVTLDFKGTYDELISFIGQVENYDKKIIISNINTAAAEGSIVSGNIILEFYGVPKLIDNDDFKWDYKVPSGKGNPFVGAGSGFANNAVSTTIEEASKPKENVSDFAMSVRSVNSDLPAIMLGSYNDKDRKTYVYGDENSAEAVEIVFVEVGGKFYFKYKVGNNSYPQQYSGNGIEFKPANKDISAVIFSNKRISSTDNAGANISVINKTSRVVNMYVSNDDSANPRVSVKGEGSAVNVKNQ